MRIDELRSPGVLNSGEKLRRIVANAISYHETQKMVRGGTPSEEAQALTDFFYEAHELMVAVLTPDAPKKTKGGK